MLRQFDFSVEPGQTYRYRSRLVFWDARAGKKEVAGTWSEPTGPVTVPWPSAKIAQLVLVGPSFSLGALTDAVMSTGSRVCSTWSTTRCHDRQARSSSRTLGSW